MFVSRLRKLGAISTSLFIMGNAHAQSIDAKSIYEFEAIDIDGKQRKLSEFEGDKNSLFSILTIVGKVCLIVNVASK
jgi:hypothetical protein